MLDYAAIGSDGNQRKRQLALELIVAAQALGAHTLYSEDLNHGQRYGRIRGSEPVS